MNYEIYLLIAYIGAVIFLIGMGLLTLSHHFARKEEEAHEFFIEKVLLPAIGNEVYELTSNLLELFPEKIVRVMRKIDQEDDDDGPVDFSLR